MQNKKFTLALVLIFSVLLVGKHTHAALTFSSSAITGTASSVFDVGSGNTLSLQTTNDGATVIGGNLTLEANTAVGTTMGSGTWTGVTVYAPFIIDKTLTSTVGSQRNAGQWTQLTLNPSSAPSTNFSTAGLFGVVVNSDNSTSFSSARVRGTESTVIWSGTGAGAFEATGSMNQVITGSSTGGNIANAYGARNKVLAQGDNLVTWAIGTQSVVGTDPGGGDGTVISAAAAHYATYYHSGGGNATTVFLNYARTDGAENSGQILGYYCATLQQTSSGTYCYYNDTPYPSYSEGPFQTLTGTKISDIADGVLTLTMDNATTGVSIDVTTNGTFKFRNLANNADASVTTGTATVSGSLIVSTSQTPANAGASCTAGTIAWDASYVYVCIATNTWKRAAISTW